MATNTQENHAAVQAGSLVEVLDDDQIWRAAVVLSTSETLSADDSTCTVKLLSSDKLLEVLVSTHTRPLKAIHALTKHDFPVGAKCKARYSLDGIWYDAIVEEHTALGCIVEYSGYKNREQVPLQHLKYPKSTKQVSNSEAPQTTSTTSTTESSDEFKIPQHLVILLDDTDAVKEKKRKRIRKLKKEHARAKSDAVQVEKQLGWKSFQAKSSKKRVRGTLTNLKKESMFKVSDNPEARVGVVGSGSGMTEFAQRKKHKA